MSWDYHMQFLAIVMVSKVSYLLYDVVQLATGEAIFVSSKYLSGMFVSDGNTLCKSKFTARKIYVHQKQNVHFKNAVKNIPYHQISNIWRTKSQSLNVYRLVLQLSLPSLLKPCVPVHQECSWSSAYRRCSNYIWLINNLIAHKGVAYIRVLTVPLFHDLTVNNVTIL